MGNTAHLNQCRKIQFKVQSLPVCTMIAGSKLTFKNMIIETTDLATKQSISIMENGVVTENMNHQGWFTINYRDSISKPEFPIVYRIRKSIKFCIKKSYGNSESQLPGFPFGSVSIIDTRFNTDSWFYYWPCWKWKSKSHIDCEWWTWWLDWLGIMFGHLRNWNSNQNKNMSAYASERKRFDSSLDRFWIMQSSRM